VPPTCKICNHEHRSAIDNALLGGQSYRAIAGQYKVSSSGLDRHKAHISSAILSVVKQEAYDESASLLERARWANSQAMWVLEEARQADNPGGVLQALDRIAKLLVVEGQFL
jgi:hypothetical protein